MLIVAGGDGSGILDSTEVLDYSSKTAWVQVAALPSARYDVHGVTVGDVFYVTGGTSYIDSIHPRKSIVSYDPESDSWQEAGTMIMNRASHGATAVPLDAMKIFCPEL